MKKKRWVRKVLVGAVAISVSAVTGGMARAKVAKSAKTSKAPKITPAAGSVDPVRAVTYPEYADGKKKAEERAGRKVAEAESITDAVLSESFVKLREDALDNRTPEQIYQLLVKLDSDAYYNTLAPDAKFAAAQMAPLLVLNGFFNRTIEWIDPNPIAHLSVVNALRVLASGVTVYLPTDQWKAGMEFLTVPNEHMGGLIRNELDFHRFLESEVVPALFKERSRLEALNFSEKPVYFDNQILYGTASFSSDRDRYVRMGEPERLLSLAGVYHSISSLESLNAYNLNGLFAVLDQYGKKFGLGSVFRYDPAVTTDETRFKILRSQNQKTHLFDLRPGGEKWMTWSYNNLTHAVLNARNAWVELRKRKDDSAAFGNLVDPRGSAPIARMVDSGLENLLAATFQKDGELVESAVVSGEKVTVHLKDFFYEPPKTLMEFMPTHFDPSPYRATVTLKRKIDGKNRREYHNFLAGRADRWNEKVYDRYVEKANGSDVQDVARVLAQSWGGWLVGVPLTSLVL